MNDMAPPPAGHNNAPDPMEEVAALHADILSEAHNWADGEPVTDEKSMKAVDAIIKGFKAYKSDLVKAGKLRTDPLHKAWKAEVAAVKVYTDDADLLQKALVAIVAPFKTKLANEKAEAERAAQQEAWRKAEEAREAARKANAGNIEAMREAAAKQEEFEQAQKAAKFASKDTVKGLRTVTRYEIKDHRAALHWIAANDKAAMTAFIEAYVKGNHKTKQIDGVDVWEEKEAF